MSVVSRNGSIVAETESVTGTGSAVRGDSPTLTTPTFVGAPTGTIASGNYTPTITAGINVAASSNPTARWMRVGNEVQVSGFVNIDATLALSTLTSFEISLPVASNITGTTNLTGSVNCDSVLQSGGITGSVANDTAIVNYLSLSAANISMFFQFQYTVQ